MMSASDEQWWDAQCGEYVLGTLRGVERDVFEKILESDRDVQVTVDFWSRQLSELDRYVQASKPPEHILPKILLKIHVDDVGKNTPEFSPTNEIHDLTSDWTRDLDETLDANTNQSQASIDRTVKKKRKYRIRPAFRKIWKILSVVSVAATIALTVLLLKQFNINKNQIVSSYADRLSIVEDASQNTVWTVTLYNDSSLATVVAVAPPPTDSSQSHQLWIVHSDGGISPLGPMPKNSGEGSTVQMPTAAQDNDVFAVSLETTASILQSAPSGPLLYSGKIQPLAVSNQ